MNILYHHRTRGKGAEGVHIRGVVKGLRQLGHEVDILSFPGASPESDLEADTGKEYGKGKKQTARESRQGLLKTLAELTQYLPEFLFEIIELSYNLIAWCRVREHIRRNRIDFVYERYSLFMFATVWLCKRKSLPIVLEINDSCQVQRVRPLSFRKLAARIENWVLKNATGLVFISSRFRDILENSYQEIAPSVISPNAADLDNFDPGRFDSEKEKARLGLAGKTVVGYVGAFVHWHGIDWFVDLIQDHLRDHPDLALLLVGDGACFKTIQEGAFKAGVQNQVILTGRVNHDEVNKYISAMDFGILPDSNDYGSPMKLFEFMAMGKGMVAPDFPPIKEVVEDKVTSWLFPANDRYACVSRVLELVGENKKINQVGKNARNYIEHERQWKHNAQQLLELVLYE